MSERFRWSERRAARLATLAVSAAVLVASAVLLLRFVQTAPNLPGGWKQYWYVPAGIVAVFAFAAVRFLRNLRLFRSDR